MASDKGSKATKKGDKKVDKKADKKADKKVVKETPSKVSPTKPAKNGVPVSSKEILEKAKAQDKVHTYGAHACAFFCSPHFL